MPSLEISNPNHESHIEAYPPLTTYAWKTIDQLVPSAQKKLIDHYAQFEAVTLQDILFIKGHDEEVTLTSIFLNSIHRILLHEDPNFQTVEVPMRKTGSLTHEPEKKSVSPCNFDLQKLKEYEDRMIIFSKLRMAPEDMYIKDRDMIIGGTNLMLKSMNRNVIPEAIR